MRKKVKRFWKVHIFDESHLSKQQNRNLSKYAALKKGFLKKSNIIGFCFQVFFYLLGYFTTLLVKHLNYLQKNHKDSKVVHLS